jgi:hypothetical protein
LCPARQAQGSHKWSTVFDGERKEEVRGGEKTDGRTKAAKRKAGRKERERGKKKGKTNEGKGLEGRGAERKRRGGEGNISSRLQPFSTVEVHTPSAQDTVIPDRILFMERKGRHGHSCHSS